jgi:hypothetical protein
MVVHLAYFNDQVQVACICVYTILCAPKYIYSIPISELNIDLTVDTMRYPLSGIQYALGWANILSHGAKFVLNEGLYNEAANSH